MSIEAKAFPAPRPSTGLNVGLWVAQVLLAAGFVMFGSMKLMTPTEKLVAMGLTMPVGLVRFIGVAEVAGALGMVLPALSRILPVLTAWAGVGLAVVMVLATGYHVIHHEVSHTPVPILLFALAAFVAWGRFKAAPIAPRS